MKSLLRRHRRQGSIGLAVIAATAALSLILMLGTVFTPSSQPRSTGAQAATIATLYPVADTILKQNNPNDNYGSTSPLSCLGSDQRIAYIKYDLAEFVNQRIISAKLQLKLTSDGGSSGDQYIEHVKSSAWQENTLTYNMVYSGSNADLKPSAVLATLEGGAANALIEIPVTQIVSQEAGKMITFACVPKELTDSDDFKFFSKEASSGKPALIIEYEPKPSPSTQPTAGPTLQPTSVSIAPTGSPGGFGGITLGQTVSGIIYITLYTDQASTSHVKFYIDSTFINDEYAYPYSLGGDTNGAVNGYDTRQLTNGPHILKAEIYYKDGASEIYQVNFNVLNNPTPTPTCIPVPACMYPGANPACAYKPPPGGWMCPMISPTPTCVPLPSPCGDPNVTCKLPALPNGGTYCIPNPTPTCIPLPSCAWPGSNPVCSLAPPPAGGSYCSAPTFTPTPTCSPRPACLDTEPRCLLADPIGGWCPLTPTPTKFCPTATPPLCPTGSSIVSDGVDANGCGRYKCGPTPTPTPNTISITPPCGGIAAPTNLTPEGTAPAGNTTLQWSTQSSATNYALRIDDMADEFLYTYIGDICRATNPNDVCVDNLTSGSYPFNLKAGHTYRWWVHAINSCGNWSVSGSAQVVVSTPVPSIDPTGVVNKISWNTPWVRFEADGFYIFVNNKYYYGDAATLQLHSDPADSGDPDYTTLEASWTENNYPMKVNFYFRKDGTNWWTEKIAVTDGNTPSSWIYLQDFGPYLKNTLHTPFNYSGDFIQSTSGLTIYFKNPTILPFLPQQITIPPVSVTIIDPSGAFCTMKPNGDANCDNKVDMIDFEIWRQEFIGTDTAKDADFDISGKVDLVDFESWRQGFVANF